MTEEQKKVAEDALYEMGVIAEILTVLGGAEISGNGPIAGTSIEWLGEQVDRLTQTATNAVQGLRPKAAMKRATAAE